MAGMMAFELAEPKAARKVSNLVVSMAGCLAGRLAALWVDGWVSLSVVKMVSWMVADSVVC